MKDWKFHLIIQGEIYIECKYMPLDLISIEMIKDQYITVDGWKSD